MSGADAPQRSGGHSGRLDVGKPTPGTRCGASAHLARCTQAPRSPAPVTLARPFAPRTAGSHIDRVQSPSGGFSRQPGAGHRQQPGGGTARSGQVPNSAAVMAGEVRPSRAGPTLAAPMTRTSRGRMADLAQDRAPRRHQAGVRGAPGPPDTHRSRQNGGGQSRCVHPLHQRDPLAHSARVRPASVDHGPTYTNTASGHHR